MLDLSCTVFVRFFLNLEFSIILYQRPIISLKLFKEKKAPKKLETSRSHCNHLSFSLIKIDTLIFKINRKFPEIYKSYKNSANKFHLNALDFRKHLTKKKL
jgi:hypothetical protein